MKLIASGVTFSAAIMRSPSFSRSSSSTMTIMRPSCISAIASSIVANCIWLQQAFYILCQDIELQVHPIFRPGCPQVRIFESIWNYCDRKNIRIRQRSYSQADAVHGDRSLFDKVTLSGFRIFHFKIPRAILPHEFPDMAHTVHVTLHDVSAELTIVPLFKLPRLVRSSVSPDISAVNVRLVIVRTVRQTPFTAMLEPVRRSSTTAFP